MPKIYFIGLKKTCLGVLDRGDRDKNKDTGLIEGGRIEMSTTVLHSRAAPSLEYLPANLSCLVAAGVFLALDKYLSASFNAPSALA